jgi:formiminotetrahydrofolate cyclodeaminase
MPRSDSLGAYLDALASADPTPGGGAAAAWTLAQAAALLCMVCRLTQGKPQAADHEASLSLLLDESLTVKSAAERLADADSTAFQAFGTAASLPKDSPAAVATRTAALQAALADAARVPLAVYALAGQLLGPGGAVRILAGIGNPRVLSDVKVAHWLALAALQASEENVRVNLALIKDPALVAQFEGLLVHGAAAAAWKQGPPHESAASAPLPDPKALERIAAFLHAVPDRVFTAPKP